MFTKLTNYKGKQVEIEIFFKKKTNVNSVLPGELKSPMFVITCILIQTDGMLKFSRHHHLFAFPSSLSKRTITLDRKKKKHNEKYIVNDKLNLLCLCQDIH